VTDTGAPVLRPIGIVESTLTEMAAAPRQGADGAPDAWLVLDPEVVDGLRGLRVGDDIFVLTWLDRARRDVLTTHPHGDPTATERGVFSTRSPHRPNPVGLHRVTIRGIEASRLRVGPLEAIHGTPVLDLKPVIDTDLRGGCG
jgi:tRNA-Thr(GGU) m(6)t(6)A37 methyltransferase TsaA